MCNTRRMLEASFWASLVLLSSVVSLMSAPSAHAGVLIGVSQDPPPPMGPFTGTDMIMVGSESNPVPIVPDPTTTAPWMKQFILNRDGIGWGTDGPTSMATVMEIFTFPALRTTVRPIDWHEDIVVDPTAPDGANFKWAGGSIEVPLGSLAPPIPGMVSDDGKSIWFDFPPQPPGTVIKITKQLMWAGTGPITPGPNGQNNYLIKVNERPSIPEPATLMLVLAILGCRIVQRGPRD